MTRIAGEHFASAVFYLVLGAIGLVWIAPTLAAGDFLSPRVAGVTHLFTLGWLTMTIFGALHQLLPVALGSPIRWVRASRASVLAFSPGVGVIALGVATNSGVARHVGLALVAIGVIVTTINIGASLAAVQSRDATWAAMVIAFAFLISTLLLGAALLHNIHTGFIAAHRIRVLAMHLHVAILGWVLTMIVGVSNRLLPMFLLAHGATTAWTRRTLIFLATGVPSLVIGLGTSSPIPKWLGVFLLELGVACFARQAYAFYRARIRKSLDVGMRFARMAFVFLIAGSIMAPVVALRGPGSTRLATAYVLTGLLGGLVMYVVGFMYKIVPLLAWTAHYHRRADMPGARTVAALYSARVARVQLIVMPAAIAILIVAILAGSALCARAGATLFLASAVLFASQMLRAALGGQLWRKTHHEVIIEGANVR